MRCATLLRMASLLALGAVCAFSAPAQQTPPDQQTGDPVADAARKARAEQKEAPKPKKVYTNDDFPADRTVNSAAAKPAADKADADQAADDKTSAENDPKSEVYWRKRFRKLRDKLAQSEKELDVLQRELNKNEVQYYPDPQKALMQQYSRADINKDAAKIDAKQKDIADLKQQISDLEDALRKAGGDPGWAR